MGKFSTKVLGRVVSQKTQEMVISVLRNESRSITDHGLYYKKSNFVLYRKLSLLGSYFENNVRVWDRNTHLTRLKFDSSF